MEKFFGIDIGGTNIKIGVVNTDGEMEQKVKYGSKDRPEDMTFADHFVNCLRNEVNNYPEIKKVGIGVPGTMSKDRSTLLELPNLPTLCGVNLLEILQSNFPEHIFHLENDANAAALGEYYFAGEKVPENYIFITLGTGVGGGVIIEHDIFKGGDGNGVEIGHMLSKNGKTLEENIGKMGIMKRAKKLMDKKKYSDSVLHSIEDLDPKKIAKEGLKGDKLALKIYKEVGKLLGENLVSTIRLLDIKNIIIGGGLAASYDIIIDPCMKALKKNLTDYYVKDISITKAHLGNNAGIMGAASLCYLK